MLRTLMTAAMACGVSGAAMAGELPYRRSPPTFEALPVFTWTGAHVGLNAGAAFGNRVTDAEGTGLGPSTAGFSGGGQAGYDLQFLGGLVVGLEVDAAYVGVDGHDSHDYDPGYRIEHRSSLDFLATARGRLGYAFDRVLVYGTGGFAVGGVDRRTTATDLVDAGTTPYQSHVHDLDGGYVYGGGVEYALPGTWLGSDRVSVKAEYLRYELDGAHASTTGSGTTTLRTEGNLARVGFNIRF